MKQHDDDGLFVLAQEDLTMVLEALKSAKSELEALEADTDWYAPTGPLFERLESAIELLADLMDTTDKGAW